MSHFISLHFGLLARQCRQSSHFGRVVVRINEVTRVKRGGLCQAWSQPEFRLWVATPLHSGESWLQRTVSSLTLPATAVTMPQSRVPESKPAWPFAWLLLLWPARFGLAGRSEWLGFDVSCTEAAEMRAWGSQPASVTQGQLLSLFPRAWQNPAWGQ